MLMRQKNLQGIVMFSSGVICGAPTSIARTKEALMEAVVKAKNLGFYRILFLCCSNRIVQVCNQNCNPSWKEKTMIYDILNLQQQGVCCKALFVPKAILDFVYNYANSATRVLGSCSWMHPALV